MDLSGLFIINSIFLGVGLAIDAFSVSVVNGFSEPGIHPLKAAKIAVVFAFFQALMPMIGWFLTHLMLQHFVILQKFVPYISLFLLCFLGINMILESKKSEKKCNCSTPVNHSGLLAQGIATSLDALSVGFTIAEYPLMGAVSCALIIASVTFIICMAGVMLGKTIGCKLSGKAEILGGIVLILIGIEIFVKGF